LTAGGGSTELYLGNDYQYVKLVDGGNVEVRTATANLANSASWTFNVAGDIDASQVLRIKVPNGVPSNVTVINSTSGSWEQNPQSNLTTTGGSGTGLTVNVTETGGYASTIAIANAGTGYLNGDLITVTSGSSSATFTIGIAGRNSWQFGGDGSTIFPTLTVTRGDRSGTLTGFTLNIGDGSQEAIISTPDANDYSAQRLVINPGKGADGTTGEGGDIYLYAGRGGDAGGTGGDIKIRGGRGPVDGAGGYLDIQGGDTDGNGVGGYIDIRGGQSGNAAGGALNLYGGYGQTNGGAVNIAGGVSANSLAQYGNVTITSGFSNWAFNNDGNLTFPDATVQSTAYVPANNLTKVAGTWTVTPGTADYSFTVPINGVYQLWVRANVPNGIISYIATVAVTNSNVPVLGTQRAWNYTGAGNPILFTTLPTQLIGTEGAISTSNPSVGTTTNVFVFGLANSTEQNITVQYGYTKIS
jgi:hypothetical protein